MKNKFSSAAFSIGVVCLIMAFLMTLQIKSVMYNHAVNSQESLRVDELLKQLAIALEARELIKINVLQNADDTPWDLIENLADLLDAVPVAVIGRKAILYRRSSRENFAHIEV